MTDNQVQADYLAAFRERQQLRMHDQPVAMIETITFNADGSSDHVWSVGEDGREIDRTHFDISPCLFRSLHAGWDLVTAKEAGITSLTRRVIR